MPTIIASAIAVAKVVGLALGASAAYAAIVGAVVIVGTVALATKAIKRKQAKQQSGISGTLVTKSGSSVSVPLVYGKRRIAGHRTHLSSDGTDNANLHFV